MSSALVQTVSLEAPSQSLSFPLPLQMAGLARGSRCRPPWLINETRGNEKRGDQVQGGEILGSLR